jgi:hypothetical protein
MPLAALLTNPAVHRRHQLMLLQLMAIAEAGCPAGSIAGTAAVQGAAADSAESLCCSNSMAGGAVTEGGVEVTAVAAAVVTAALQHYGLLRCDQYQQQFLRNSAAACTERRSSADDNDSSDANSTQGISCRSSTQQQQQLGTAASVADLLVWLSRSGQTEAVLLRVLEVAQGEQQLAQQVRVIDNKQLPQCTMDGG